MTVILRSLTLLLLVCYTSLGAAQQETLPGSATPGAAAEEAPAAERAATDVIIESEAKLKGDGPTLGEIEDEVARIESRLERFDSKMDAIAALEGVVDKLTDTDREAVQYRRDERGFDMLRELDEISRAAGKLPEDEPVRVELTRRLSEDYADVGKHILLRTNDLSLRIGQFKEDAQAASGPERVALEAYIDALQELRIASYGAAADLIEGRSALGLPVDDLIAVLSRELYVHAETLVGRLKFYGTAAETMRLQLSSDPDNADLAVAAKRFVNTHKVDVGRLKAISAQMERIGIDNTTYKTVVLQEGQEFSVQDIERDVIVAMVEEKVSEIQDWLKEKGPDLFFDAIVVIAVLLLFRILARLTKRLVKAATERSGEHMSTLLKDVLASVSGGLVMFIGVLTALSQLGITLGPMLAGLGVAGFIVGFALQDTLGNFAAGGMILLYRPYDVDDFVEVTGASGLVKKMSLVSTTITTFDNQTLVVPNSKIWGDVIKNVTAQKVRRVDMEFGISYSDDIEKAERVLQDIVDNHEHILKKPAAMIKLHTLGDSSVNFIVRPWVKTSDYWDTYWDITREVKLRFDREGISIPFPQRDVHVYRDNA